MIDEKDIVVEKINKLDIRNEDIVIFYIDTERYPFEIWNELHEYIRRMVRGEMGVKNPILFLPKDYIKLSKDIRENIISILRE